ncbi:MAG TPA: cytochrome P450 [Bryobacteraceae bacterium]|nr:cytochrome P450 [Bryobacteraceae bacterium]
MGITPEPFGNDPLSPPAPQDLYFSEAHQAWILSRHRDVLAALRSTDLAQARRPKASADLSAKPDRETCCIAVANGWIHSEVVTALQATQTFERQTEMNAWASALLERFLKDRPVDLAAQFFGPWCLASAVALTAVDPAHTERLRQLVKYLSEGDRSPHELDVKYRAKEANKELDRYFVRPGGSHAKSMFLGIAQTLPYFLASAWSALLQHPSQVKQLQRHPGWMLKATEELLRYAGPVHTLFRRADRDTDTGGTKIKSGDRLILRLRSANRDPQQFPNPDRLDFTRDVAGHLALSAGPHYCVGASLVRTMTAMATQAILTRYAEPRLSNPVEWCCGTMLIWPSSLQVLLRNPLDDSA